MRVGSITDQIASQDLRKEVQNILSLLGPIGNPPAPVASPLADDEGRLCGTTENKKLLQLWLKVVRSVG